MVYQLSAFGIIVNQNTGEILAVSRKSNPNMWGLPGGKFSANEDDDLEDTIARELKEELSPVLWKSAVIHYNLVSTRAVLETADKQKHRIASAFLVSPNDTMFLLQEERSWIVRKMSWEKAIQLPYRNEEGCVVRWVPPTVLKDKETCAYHEYNTYVLNLLGI